MELGLAGKVALITGASDGLGKAIAWALAREGVAVALCARRGALLTEVAEAIARQTGAKTLAHQADMTQIENIRTFVELARVNLGRVDILVNNAGSSRAGSFSAVSEQDWRDAIELKLMGYLRASREVLPTMRAQGNGCIINIVGLAGKQAMGSYVLGGINALLLHFTKALADEVGPDGIRVMAINPGLTQTARVDQMFETWAQAQGVSAEEYARKQAEAIPLRRLGQPEDVADTVVFLASDRASYLTGSSVQIEGGSWRGF